MSEIREIKIGLVSISDRASRNEYQDLGAKNNRRLHRIDPTRLELELELALAAENGA